VTNTGSAACTLQGYPGLSTIDAGGTQVGTAAEHRCCEPTAFTLAPGDQAHAPFTITEAGYAGNPGCPALMRVTTLRLFPPDERADLRAPLDTSRCADIPGGLKVGALAPGTEWTDREMANL
jgi:hypothetical protein